MSNEKGHKEVGSIRVSQTCFADVEVANYKRQFRGHNLTISKVEVQVNSSFLVLRKKSILLKWIIWCQI